MGTLLAEAAGRSAKPFQSFSAAVTASCHYLSATCFIEHIVAYYCMRQAYKIRKVTDKRK